MAEEQDRQPVEPELIDPSALESEPAVIVKSGLALAVGAGQDLNMDSSITLSAGAGRDMTISDSVLVSGAAARDLAVSDGVMALAMAGKDMLVTDGGAGLAVGRTITAHQSRLGLVVARTVQLEEGSSVAVQASHKQVLLFGLAVGAVLGLFSLIFRRKP